MFRTPQPSRVRATAQPSVPAPRSRTRVRASMSVSSSGTWRHRISLRLRSALASASESPLMREPRSAILGVALPLGPSSQPTTLGTGSMGDAKGGSPQLARSTSTRTLRSSCTQPSQRSSRAAPRMAASDGPRIARRVTRSRPHAVRRWMQRFLAGHPSACSLAAGSKKAKTSAPRSSYSHASARDSARGPPGPMMPVTARKGGTEVVSERKAASPEYRRRTTGTPASARRERSVPGEVKGVAVAKAGNAKK
mmetsp:Transcript_1936/g.6694  ORF Transcript_1936/g.6694 Transcript_1936/m.6694 type:complete len:252 (-) Transcript_1936:547-1302(-)